MSRLPRPFQTLPSLMASTMYEVNIRQYTAEGTFSAFAAHLPRLQDMGVDILWFMPITPISLLNRQGTLGSYYACSDYVSVNPEFGSLADFQQLVRQAQERGMRVILDWVANHTGWDHVWTKSHPGYYKKNAAGQFYDKNGWHDVIDLNYYDAALRKEMIHSMQFWIDQCGIDGFRCDMAHLVPLDFWKQARNQLDSLKPLIWLGETEDISYLQVFDCCYSWSWMHNTLHFFKGEIGLAQLRNVLQRYQMDFPADTLQLYFTTNHDENSWNGTEYEKYGSAARLLAVFSFLWRGIPLVYSGQELPNTRRLKFFDKDEIPWSHEPVLHTFYKQMMHFRKSHPVFSAAADAWPTWVVTPYDDQLLAFSRRSQHSQVIVLLNFSSQSLTFTSADLGIRGKFNDLFTGETLDWTNSAPVALKPYDYLVGVS